jgi:hypothetical protein
MSYTCLVKMRTNALMQVEFWFAMAEQNNSIPMHKEAIRYCKIMNRIEAEMWQYPSVNTLRHA